MITNENIILIVGLGATALVICFLLILFHSTRRELGRVDVSPIKVNEKAPTTLATFPTMTTTELLAYWRKVKETIHLFDDIIVRYVVQWSNILLIMIGASVLVFPTSSLVAGILSLAATIASLPIAIKCYFYYELLEGALGVGLDIEKLIFKGEECATRFGLTHRLFYISTRRTWGITFFGWSILLPFMVFAILSSTLALFYFNVITTVTQVILMLCALPIVMIFLLFVRGRTRARA